MKTVQSYIKWLLLAAFSMAATSVVADDLPIGEQSCLYYQSKDAESLRTAAKKSAATKLGLKIGLIVRKRTTVQWVLAYQQGFTDASDGNAPLQSSEQVTTYLDAYCAENTEATLLQAARALMNVEK